MYLLGCGEEEWEPESYGAACKLWVGQQVSVKRMISVQYTHLKEWVLESLRSPRQGFRVECDQPLNNMVNDIVLTSCHA